MRRGNCPEALHVWGGGGSVLPPPPAVITGFLPAPCSSWILFISMERKFSLDVKGGGGVGREAKENFLYMETKTGRETFSFIKIIFSSPLR